jgi:hypothetical protein
MRLRRLLTFVLAAAPAALAQHDDCAPSRDRLSRPTYHLEKARQAFTQRRSTAMWKHLEAAIRRQPHREGVPQQIRAVGDFLARLEPFFLKDDLHQAATGQRVTALLRHARTHLSIGRHAALVELLAREPDATHVLRGEARTNANIARRMLALQALLRRGEPGDRTLVLRALLHDRSRLVRSRVTDVVRSGIRGRDVRYLGQGLRSRSHVVRARTAELFGELGHPAAVELLVAAAPKAATGLAAPPIQNTRGHVALVRQTSYVPDMDVEVASAAFIADPKVDVIQDGAVLDATTVNVQQVRFVRKAYRRALRKLVGEDPGRDHTRWARFVADRK